LGAHHRHGGWRAFETGGYFVRTITTFFLALIAIASGVVVLLGYFLPAIPFFVNLRVAFLNWAMILAAVAVFVGIANLFSVHTQKLRNKNETAYSVLLLVFLLGTFALGLFLGTTSPAMNFVFTSIQIPVETSLMALLAVSLLYATIRLLRWRANFMSITFIVTALIIFLGTAPLPFLGPIPFFSDWLRPVIAQVPAAAGARGILLGVALGTLMTGLRILFGADRPYGGK
jgi:hypothetical protein